MAPRSDVFYCLFSLHAHIHTDHVCGFEDERICGFSQDRSDVFDWTRQNHLSQNPKRSANTGPETDRSGTKEGVKTDSVLCTLVKVIQQDGGKKNSETRNK